ncbi:hypothetical protein [Haloarcula litorea]|uniref:hypothetical protein n=1 Tax=Haloarcula litorea TaxID=3032579 RepID=UPI0023E80744|nr:hypothetical protein [Halomicroarcula sp. GDY20]
MTEQRRSRGRSERPHDHRHGADRGVRRRLSSPAWLAHAAGVALSGLAVGFVALFVAVLAAGGDIALVTRPLPMRIALALPPAIAVLTAATTAGAVLAWANGYWSLRGRLHQTAVALLGLGFSWQLAALGLLSL